MDLFLRERGRMSEVEAECPGLHLGTSLNHMRPQDLTQGGIQQVGRCVGLLGAWEEGERPWGGDGDADPTCARDPPPRSPLAR